MDLKILDNVVFPESFLQETEEPLLENAPNKKTPKTPTQRAIRKAFKGTAHLSNLLPTGTVLAYQILSPILTHQGSCKTFTSQITTLTLISVCAISCFVLCFTDSFRDDKGKVRYGLATCRGLWVIDGSVASVPPEEEEKYRVRFVDFFHGFITVVVFGAVALFDQNVVKCFCPTPTEEMKEVLVVVPVGIGVVCSLLFVAFPTKRHGIGFPLSRC